MKSDLQNPIKNILLVLDYIYVELKNKQEHLYDTNIELSIDEINKNIIPRINSHLDTLDLMISRSIDISLERFFNTSKGYEGDIKNLYATFERIEKKILDNNTLERFIKSKTIIKDIIGEYTEIHPIEELDGVEKYLYLKELGFFELEAFKRSTLYSQESKCKILAKITGVTARTAKGFLNGEDKYTPAQITIKKVQDSLNKMKLGG